ncbi:MAG: hypothetical protein OZSIB_3651 [Candidatus Ozemobacter sibiricus]|jgi:predicted RNA-binding protein|uniref:Inner membrane protein YgaP-like transmembrane domain-containing protein n=1 Tax=Candidatus Ozemobacter sibiricus TaxID=2268124 RepID=A0A367ZQM9_9BACT|nr:MAG: hypothetical protein OZSIB_3651 [Candidatus Ozemobacter sibiricus]
MKTEQIVRLVAGTMVTASVILSQFHHPAWALLTIFVGLNLFQSALTRWCLLEDILRLAGFESCCAEAPARKEA